MGSNDPIIWATEPARSGTDPMWGAIAALMLLAAMGWGLIESFGWMMGLSLFFAVIIVLAAIRRF